MTTVPTTDSTVIVPTSTASGAPSRTRRVTTAALVLATAFVALGLGALAGQRLTGSATVAPPAHPTGAVSYPKDWQQYRAGERNAHVFLDEPWRGVGVPGGD